MTSTSRTGEPSSRPAGPCDPAPAPLPEGLLRRYGPRPDRERGPFLGTAIQDEVMQGSRDTLPAPRRPYQQFRQGEGTAGMLRGDLGWQRGRQVFPPGGGRPQRHSRGKTDQVVTMTGLRQDKARLAAPHPQLPGEQRPLIGLTINVTVNIQQFARVPSGPPAVQ